MNKKLKDTSIPLLAGDRHGADPFKPSLAILATSPLRHPAMNRDKSNRLLGYLFKDRQSGATESLSSGAWNTIKTPRRAPIFSVIS